MSIKFKVISIESRSNGTDDQIYTVAKMTPTFDGHFQFFIAKVPGNIQVGSDKPKLMKQFEIGKEYNVTIEKV